MLPWPRPPPILVLNVVFGKIVSNPSCIPNLKLLVSTVAEISRGPNFFGCTLAKTPPILVLNIFFGKLVPNQICVPNLKLLASTVAEIRRGSHLLCAPLAQTPANFGPKRHFW